MTEKEILNIFKETNALLRGHFQLSSRLHSPQYLQCAKVLQYPKYAQALCGALTEKISNLFGKNEKIDAVIAPALGGILVSYEIARFLKTKSLFTERIDGKMVLRRGFRLNNRDNVLVVEDVITTGLSTKEVIDVVNDHKANVVGVGCLVDRSKKKIDFSAQLISLIKMDIPTFEPRDCPLCKDNTPFTKPGSRAIK